MKYSFSIFIAFFVMFISTGCSDPTRGSSMPPPTPPATFSDAQPGSSLGEIDPNMEHEQQVAEGSSQLDRPLSKLEQLDTDPVNKKKYEALKKKKEWDEEQIRQADMDRRGADIAILDIIQGGHKEIDLNNNPTDPEEDLKHQRWIKKQAALVTDGLSKDLANINRKMDEILNESTRTCFPKGTQIIMSNSTMKSIDDIVAGDSIMVFNIGKNTIETSTLKQTWISKNNHLYVLNNFIQATAYERLLTNYGWKKMRDIQIGEKIFDGNNYVLVKTKTKIYKDINVYNLTINKSHNFFVATSKNKDTLFLVHNCGGGSGGGSGGGK